MKVMPTILVLILAALSVAVLLFVERGGPNGPAGDGEVGPLFTARELPVDEVTRITLRRGDSNIRTGGNRHRKRTHLRGRTGM